MDLGYSAAGFVVGFIVGMTGVGGGSLMTPILVLLFGIKPALAVGTDLLYASITKASGIIVHNKNGTILWPVVGLLALGSVPTSIATVFALKQLSEHGIDPSGLITSALGVALILTSFAILSRNTIIRLTAGPWFEPMRALHERHQTAMTVGCGFILGVLVTLSSVGAGALGVVLLFFLYPRLPAKQIIGTDLAHAVPLTAVAGLGHAHLGTVDYILLANLLIGSLPGIYLGSNLGVKLPDYVTRPALATMLLFIGVKFAAPIF
ncbi:MAG TPA: sulfite exporter TauE/SafE family protein [Gammaproteobacteria bacterium]|nr:sulfite exporter TauE/SafE family protein [Gammaproteobacteria bacterium]